MIFKRRLKDVLCPDFGSWCYLGIRALYLDFYMTTYFM